MNKFKNKNILVSYLIVAFNEERYIQKCLYSLIAQSYSNIELIFVDDGSEDNTFTIAENLLNSQNRLIFKLVKFDSNKGKVYAFNKAFSYSKGEIITLFGADDIVPVMRTEIAINEIINKNIDYLYGSFRKFSNKEDLKIGKLSKLKEGKMFYTNWVPGGTSFLKRSLALNIFPLPTFIKAEDWYISTKAQKLGVHPVYINENFSYYRIHENNDSSISDIPKYINQLNREINVLNYFLKEEESNSMQKHIILSKKYRYLIIQFLNKKNLILFLKLLFLFFTPLRLYMLLAIKLFIKNKS